MEDVTACVREYIAQNDISVAQMSSDLGIEESRLRPGDGGKFSAAVIMPVVRILKNRGEFATVQPAELLQEFSGLSKKNCNGSAV